MCPRMRGQTWFMKVEIVSITDNDAAYCKNSGPQSIDLGLSDQLPIKLWLELIHARFLYPRPEF